MRPTTSSRLLAATLVAATLLALALPRRAAAQSGPYDGPTATAQRRAQTLVTSALAALGGAAHPTLRAATVELRARSFLGPQGQGIAPGVSEPPLSAALTVSLDLDRGRVASEGDAVFHGGYRFVSRTAVAGAAGSTENLAGIGPGPYRTAVAPAAVAATRSSLAWTLPHFLLEEMLARPQALRALGDHAVTFAAPNGAQITLTLDAATGLPARYETVRDEPFLGDVVAAVEFPAWRWLALGAKDSVRVPVRRVQRLNGVVVREDDYVVTPGTRAADDARLAVATPDPVTNEPPADRRLADGVFVLERLQGAWNALLVGFRDFSVIVEAPGSPEAGEEALARARKLLPNAPVRYVVTTHHHADHVGGVRPFVAEGITVLTTPAAAGVVRAVAAATHTMRPDRLSRAPRAPKVETVPDGRTITDGTRRLELHPLGRTSHAAEMLAAYLPAEQVLFQADMLILPDSGVTAPIAVNRELADIIREHGLDVRTIVGVHGRSGTIEELRRTLATPPRPTPARAAP